MLQVGHLSSLPVKEMTSQCDNELAATAERQAKEISHLVSGIGEFSTEAEVNTLAACHCEDQNVIQAKIDSQIDSMQETQRREHREWLDFMSVNHWSFHEVLHGQEFSLQICVYITYLGDAQICGSER